jgi:hypothetical protein
MLTEAGNYRHGGLSPMKNAAAHPFRDTQQQENALSVYLSG